MRKFITILLSLSMICALTSCGDEKPGFSDEFEYVEDSDEDEKKKSEPETEQETEPETEPETDPETEPEAEPETDPEPLTEAPETEAVTEFEPLNGDQEFQRVGAENYGYIDIPSDWVEFNEIGMADAEMLQYSDITGQSVITMQYFEGVEAETGASNVYAALEGNCDGLTAAMVEIGGYEAYQVYCFYPDTAEFLVCWLFDGDDGFAHYIAIEGTDMGVFDLSETYSLYE